MAVRQFNFRWVYEPPRFSVKEGATLDPIPYGEIEVRIYRPGNDRMAMEQLYNFERGMRSIFDTIVQEAWDGKV